VSSLATESPRNPDQLSTSSSALFTAYCYSFWPKSRHHPLPLDMIPLQSGSVSNRFFLASCTICFDGCNVGLSGCSVFKQSPAQKLHHRSLDRMFAIVARTSLTHCMAPCGLFAVRVTHALLFFAATVVSPGVCDACVKGCYADAWCVGGNSQIADVAPSAVVNC
jgi:hypothetical protein